MFPDRRRLEDGGERGRDGEVQIGRHKVTGDVKDSTGNRVNNMVITVCGAWWGLDLRGDHSVNYVNV